MMRDAAATSDQQLLRKRKHTLDEMRAALGTFYVASL